MNRASPGQNPGRSLSWLLTPVLAGLAQPAHAQLLQDASTVVIPPAPRLNVDRSIFQRDGDIPVTERIQPGLSAQGLRLGDFDLYPGLAVGGRVTSNLYADNRRRVADIALVARPELTLRTSSGPNYFDIHGQADLRRYASHGSENSDEGLIGIEGALATGAFSTVSAGLSYASLITPRYGADSPPRAARPLAYRALTAHIGATLEGTRTRLILRADLTQLRYSDPPMIGGGMLFSRDRDRTRYQGAARLERAISPTVSFYVAGTANRVDYALTPPPSLSRNSSGFGLYAGSSFEVSRLMRGDIRLGYIEQDFRVAGVPAIKGFGAKGELLYFPNRLWTVTLRGESSVQDSGVPGTTGVLHRGGSLRSDHELRRYLIVSAEAGYFDDLYRGVARHDRLPFAGVSATYLSRGHSSVELAYRFTARNCNCTAGNTTSYDDHRLTLTLTLQM